MGIKGLTKLLKIHAPNSIREEKLESYCGKRIAIDVSISIYQFLVVVGRNGYGTLTNKSGKVTSHLQGMFYRTTRLLEAGMMPVYVFDGEPPDMKKNALMRRFSRHEKAAENLMQAIKIGERTDIVKYSKQTVKVTKQHNEDCKTLLTLMGLPVVQAPCEAEAECAFLCKVGKVDAVASEDTDSLAFGSPRLLRCLMVGSTKNPIMDFEMSKVLEELNLSMDQFVDMCILCGCDYCDGIGGIGPQTSLKLIRKHGSIEEIVGNIDTKRFQIPVDWPYSQARCLFKAPQITCPQQLKFEWSTPDEEGLKEFLIDENGFNYERVMKVIGKIKTIKDKSSQGKQV